jgi:hypothetical protein
VCDKTKVASPLPVGRQLQRMCIYVRVYKHFIPSCFCRRHPRRVIKCRKCRPRCVVIASLSLSRGHGAGVRRWLGNPLCISPPTRAGELPARRKTQRRKKPPARTMSVSLFAPGTLSRVSRVSRICLGVSPERAHTAAQQVHQQT